ncbi:hypothetical protein PG997_003669 [Apiospora hydei]|uniref:Uncharacterized protein n=1 Tax=Apiospora hydei TaxID=1337664 RepID=A0ABR1WZV6_9PEZI
MAASSGMSTRESEDSRDLLRDPVREVRRRFRAAISLSPKGLGRVEQGSEETARSVESAEALESRSIWLVQTQMKELQVRLSKLGAFARDGSAACRLRLYQHVDWNARVGENVGQGDADKVGWDNRGQAQRKTEKERRKKNWLNPRPHLKGSQEYGTGKLNYPPRSTSNVNPQLNALHGD